MKNKSEKLRVLWAFCLLLFIGATMRAEASNSLFVKSGDKENTFAITDVKEVTFADEFMTVVKTDDTEVTFDGNWEISFGNSDATGLKELTFGASGTGVEIYDMQGILMKKASSLSEVNLNELPSGTYIIKCDNKTLKIKI